MSQCNHAHHSGGHACCGGAHDDDAAAGHAHEHDGHDHDAMSGPLAELVTLRDWLRYAVTRFNRDGVHFGHGCSSAFDEAAWLLLHQLHLPNDRLEPFLDACILSEERQTLFDAIERRCVERVPTAYITGEAWMGDFRFSVDPRVIVPRSYFGELLEEGLSPWVEDNESVTSALDLCTGSGCLAILLAHAFPHADITAVDLSDDALAVAQDNIADYGLETRIALHKGDVFEGLEGRRFDVIISNPPYVTADAMAALPQEYLHEPRMALAAGDDGLDIVRRLLSQARNHLNPGGLLAVEVGHNRDIVDAAFPELPLIWLSARGDDDVVFAIRAEDLPAQAA